MKSIYQSVLSSVAFLSVAVSAISVLAGPNDPTGVVYWQPVTDPCLTGTAPNGLCKTPEEAHKSSLSRFSSHIAWAMWPVMNGKGTIGHYSGFHTTLTSSGTLNYNRYCETQGGGIIGFDEPCAPKDQTENGPQCQALRGPGKAGNPIDVRTGNKYQVVTDFETSGPDPLVFKRYYNSQDEGKRSLTYTRWRTSYDRRLLIASGGNDIHVWRHTGRAWHFELDNGSWVSASGQEDSNLTLTANGSDWDLTVLDGTVETYNSDGLLTSIKQPNGYVQTVSYTSGRPSTVTDSYGRQISFTYEDVADKGAVYRLQSVTDPNGIVHSYAYGDTIGNLISVTRGDYGTETYHYENTKYLGYLTGITDERGVRFATWSYNDDGLAISSEHAGGAEKATITYNANGTRTVTNALGKETIYHITQTATGPRVSQVEGEPSANCLAADTSYAYDAKGYVNSITDAEGNVTSRSNDAKGRPLTITEGVGTAEERTTTYVWHGTFNKPTKIERSGLLKVEFTYDGTTGDLLTRTETDLTSHTVPYSTNGETRIWSYSYQYDSTTSEKLEKITLDGPRSGAGDSTIYDYDAAGHLSKVTNALGHETTVTAVNGLGQPTSLTDENGVVTALTYNERGWLSSVTVNPGAGESRTRLYYDGVGQVIRTRLPDGEEIRYEYDNARYLTGIENNRGERIEYGVDLLGNVTLEEIKSHGMTTIIVEQNAIAALHLAETAGVPELRAEVAAQFDVLLIEEHVEPERCAAHRAESQRVGAVFPDQFERVRRVAERFRHLSTLLVADDAGEVDVLERQASHELVARHDHARHPEEDDVRPGDEIRRRIELLQRRRLLRPPHRRKRPQPRAEPSVEHVWVLGEASLLQKLDVRFKSG